ncbi:MAG: hypothetical protein AAGK37_16795 [Pseudomonadota bacterium]
MKTMKVARTFVLLNAVFSLVMGAWFLIAADPVAGWLFAAPTSPLSTVIRVLGIGLILFSASLIVLATDRFATPRKVVLVSAMDTLWVVGSGALLLVGGHLFSPVGQVAIALVAACVAALATGQYLGVRTYVPPRSQASVKISGEEFSFRCPGLSTRRKAQSGRL